MGKVETTKNAQSYESFYNEAKSTFGARIYKDYMYRFALGTDASCYRYIPQIVVRAFSEDEVIFILHLSAKYRLPLTFRAYGSSLSGQSLSDSILVITTFNWRDIKVRENTINLGCGVIGSDANLALANLGKKIGPDPATITMASIGGIVANNSSGMCCGVKQNSYQTIKSIRVILCDGTIIDTSKNAKESESVENFIKTHPQIAESLLDLRREILADSALSSMISRKYKIKNTTGYSINALLDFSEIRDILNHIFVGSEGTLGFISSVELEIVDDEKYKACALLFYENMREASYGVQVCAKNSDIINSAEIMDYYSLKSVENLDGVPEIIKSIKQDYACILIQTQSNNEAELERNLTKIKSELSHTRLIFAPLFSRDSKEYNSWWKIRKGLFPIAASIRKRGTSVIIEDVCFEIDKFADGVAFIQDLFKEFGFDDGIIFGHALSGNVHFIIMPNLDNPKERANFEGLVSKMAQGVAESGGSVKAEHGTGRMVAPFVELEWGAKAYAINRKIKAIFDPNGLLNSDVIITNDPQIHTKNLKEMTRLADFVDKCMECGFCEKACPSNFLTLTPRQRITITREMARLEKLNSRESRELLVELKRDYAYAGDETCAACSQCASLCPLEIDTAKIALNFRKSAKKGENIAWHIYKNLWFYVAFARFGLKIANVIGIDFLRKIPRFRLFGIKTPYIPRNLPRANRFNFKDSRESFNQQSDSKTKQTASLPDLSPQDKAQERVIYFSACMNRAFAPSKILAQKGDSRSIQEVFYSICKKARIEVIMPKNIAKMCCGKAFIDYNFAMNLDELVALSEGGKIPIVLDHSACSQHLATQIRADSRLKCLKILDFAEFLLNIKDRLQFKKLNENIATYAMCALKKNGKADLVAQIARLCTNGKVLNEERVKCCGFAGNKGFFTPELNDNALQNLSDFTRDSSASLRITRGFATSSTCEIGLNDKSALIWQHIAYLVDEVASEGS